jgi:hypothetical protein
MRALVFFITATLSAPALAGDVVSFRRDVVPILTKLGCNAGACHGTPSGKNGFRLSLRGYDPAADHAMLTREQFARRIDRLDPAASLMVTKASGRSPHEGSTRFSPGDFYDATIQRWIAEGAGDDKATRPIRLTVDPSQAILTGEMSERPLRVMAQFDSGPVTDVTKLVRFSSTDESIASVSVDGIVRKRKRGEATIIAEYCGLMATTTILLRDAAPTFQPKPFPSTNPIDALAAKKWDDLQYEPSGLCTDEEFIRRAHLDAIGRLPTPERIRAFAADTRPDKRNQLIDELLARPEYADWWGQKWADRLGVNQRFVGIIGATKYHRWIRDQIAANVPEDRFVREIVTATGGNYSQPAAGFYRRLRDPAIRAEEVSQLFLGVRIGCAKCHNHPGERWTQDDYAGFAAFFARMTYRDGPFFIQVYDKEETVLNTRRGEFIHPRNGKVAPPVFLGGDKLPESSDERREKLATWLTAPGNPYFAKASVNRIWFHLFGQGIVEPVDDFRITNPASHPALLDMLAKEFIESGFDRKTMIRRIMTSRMYQLSSATTPSNRDDHRHFSHASIRRLGAEQLLDAIADATGTPAKFPGLPLGSPAAMLADGEYQHPFLTAFGRPARAMACECEREADTTLSQALHLGGGRSFDAQLRHKDGRIAKLIEKKKTDSEIVDELFLVTLGRNPTSAEREASLSRIPDNTPEDRRRAIENLLHALLNHPEFVFQH